MKFLFVVAFVSMAAFVMAQDKYTDRWDNIDLDEILTSDRLLKNYVDCLLDKGRCTPDGKALKETLPDALEHDCSKCTEKQKEGSKKVIKHFVNKRPELWEQLSKKYDPNGEYSGKFRDTFEELKN